MENNYWPDDIHHLIFTYSNYAYTHRDTDKNQINGLVQDHSNSIADALHLLQSFTELSK